ncbi:hypothetical protein BO85DRAFT_486024 [Aspergillus piperis CBS 112811]|uniref:Uncharacterized protein n=1 Tax=Aspergillus piperis CBS 112811 TaxID=1448313 RepID=A0A8G1R6G5_9EURO|nr:hypothetical protein BO85DRAFT_486024 [Aspergillus piperis CBS 112811]RAH59551.1 hypothetical protein BO85DRAFT_486024 [Aspergillus piperis CBS 112811]
MDAAHEAIGTANTVDEVRLWLQTNLFQPHFLTYYKAAILPRQQAGTLKRGESFLTITNKLEAAKQAGDTKYSDHYPDTIDWNFEDHSARCLQTIVDVNTNNADGLFYRHGKSTEGYVIFYAGGPITWSSSKQKA